jgi:hypothetical protein
MSTNQTPRRSKRSIATEDVSGANHVTPDYDPKTKRLKTRIQVEKRVALRSANFCTELLPDGDSNNDNALQSKICCRNCCLYYTVVQLHKRKEKPRSGWRKEHKPCKKLWTIEMSTLKKPDDIKLKTEIDSYIINCDFIDPFEPPEQTQQAPPPVENEVASPQPSSSNDDDDDDDETDTLPSNDADDIRRKLKEAWEQIYPTVTFPDERVFVSTAGASCRYALVKTTLKNGCASEHPGNYQLITKGYFTTLEQRSIMIISFNKLLKQKKNHPSEYTRVCWGGLSGGNPQVSPRNIVAAAIISRDTFFCEWKAKCAEHKQWDGTGFAFIQCSIKKMAACTPCDSAIELFTKDLAVKQAIIQHSHLLRAPKVALQNDGGHKESEIKMLVTFDPDDKTDTPDGSIREFLLDICKSGKKAPEVALAVDMALAKVGFPRSDEEADEDEDVLQLGAATVDSGCGTPESFEEALANINRMDPEDSDVVLTTKLPMRLNDKPVVTFHPDFSASSLFPTFVQAHTSRQSNKNLSVEIFPIRRQGITQPKSKC